MTNPHAAHGPKAHGRKTSIPWITLNDGTAMPVLGLGVAKLSDEETEESILAALDAGCRLIDTAASYGNEEIVGHAIAQSGIPREELFVSTKLSSFDQGFTTAQAACKASVERLGLDYVDLYLIHWPVPQLGRYVESFEGMMQAEEQGYARSIGVCNFTKDHLAELIDATSVVPVVNQVELHPRLTQEELRAINAFHDIVTQSYSPLGVGEMLEHPTVTSIAAEYSRSPAQVLLRWNLQLYNSVLVRSSKPHRVAENLDVFDFDLTGDHLDLLHGLNDGTRVIHDPETFLDHVDEGPSALLGPEA
jgi:diketogulonate reductase-like aldo/keto reductase